MLTQPEAIEYARALMDEPGDIGDRQRAVQAFWVQWVEERDRPALRTAECEQCGTIIEAKPGQRGMLPKRCPSCVSADEPPEPERKECEQCGAVIERRPRQTGVLARRCPECMAADAPAEPERKECVACGGVIERRPGQRGRLATRCEYCRAA